MSQALRLRNDVLAIWNAGVEAVGSQRLIPQALRVEGPWLRAGDQAVDLRAINRIVVIGAGKAAAGMAAAVEEALGARLLREKQVTGWVHVPDDCLRPLSHIHLHPARPPGVNEPTEAGVAGAREMLHRVASLGPQDLCLALWSGGGSALLPAPAEGITLADKLAVTRFLSAAGANIEELNTVRKQLSRIKGGKLARACRAGWLISLIISDVLGDRLEVIASGPTVPDSSTPEAALEILQRFGGLAGGVPHSVIAYLQAQARFRAAHGVALPQHPEGTRPDFSPCRVTHCVVGNNATSVAAAAEEARRRGYTPALVCPSRCEGLAEEVGRQLADEALAMRGGSGPDCLVSGGEPVVRLVEPPLRGLGGRNQQLVLAAVKHLWEDGARGIAILSGGTDGEDGPTDAAGAFLDAQVLAAARSQNLHPDPFLARNDAYHFFAPLGALVRTGPTHTNVCDLRVAVVDRRADTVALGPTGRPSSP